MKQLLAISILGCLLTACEPAPQNFASGEFPRNLSDWSMLRVEGRELALHSDATPYDLNTPLFTDYAHKFRTVWTPAGMSGEITSEGKLELPVGSIITKTFYYPTTDVGPVHAEAEATHFTGSGLNLDAVRLVETRVLVRRNDGWHGLPYVWNHAQTHATLEITGSVLPLQVAGLGQFNYVVPDVNQCEGCHVTDLASKQIEPIGLKNRHLEKAYAWHDQPASQVAHLSARHHLTQNQQPVIANAVWGDASINLDHRARSYLDINCGHCHSPTGPADTSGMFLNIEETDMLKVGVCKPPIAAGQGTGGFLFGINPGHGGESITTYRMRSVDPGAMMPELGRSLVHEEGVALIAGWITQMDGSCL